MKRAMIDIETLGVGRDAIITELAVVLSEDGRLDESIHLYLDWDEQEKLGRTIDTWTLRWWLSGGRTSMLTESEAVQSNKRNTLLSDMTFAYSIISQADEVWANSPSFDVAIINSLLRQLGKPNIDHTRERDFRTVRKLNPDVVYEYPVDAHNALADAKAQVEHLRKLGIWSAAYKGEVANG